MWKYGRNRISMIKKKRGGKKKELFLSDKMVSKIERETGIKKVEIKVEERRGEWGREIYREMKKETR